MPCQTWLGCQCGRRYDAGQSEPGPSPHQPSPVQLRRGCAVEDIWHKSVPACMGHPAWHGMACVLGTHAATWHACMMPHGVHEHMHVAWRACAHGWRSTICMHAWTPAAEWHACVAHGLRTCMALINKLVLHGMHARIVPHTCQHQPVVRVALHAVLSPPHQQSVPAWQAFPQRRRRHARSH